MPNRLREDAAARKPFKSIRGLWADLNIRLTAGCRLKRAGAKCGKNFPRDHSSVPRWRSKSFREWPRKPLMPATQSGYPIYDSGHLRRRTCVPCRKDIDWPGRCP